MKLKSKILIITGCLMLSTMYYFPLWVIDLKAPQYPEGLGLHIWINKITGANPHDLNKINNLNHYIGMKPIKPDSISELKIMPWVVRFFMVLSFVVAILGNKKIFLVLIILFALMAVIGFVDYYMWGYDYGHNLDMDKAIIKIPGQSYQPPLIGEKTILNFRAISLPGLGGWAAVISYFLWLFVYFREYKKKKQVS